MPSPQIGSHPKCSTSSFPTQASAVDAPVPANSYPGLTLRIGRVFPMEWALWIMRLISAWVIAGVGPDLFCSMLISISTSLPYNSNDILWGGVWGLQVEIPLDFCFEC